ncbi:MAG: hypothetical protein IT558_04980 [Alphaproteobacteria bacterium]|nr:hypothetical protein [Alphaproteobacteria bacterium]
MSLSLSSWAQTVAAGILIACCLFIIYVTQTAPLDDYYLWHQITPLLAMQLVIAALCSMNGSTVIPGITVFLSLGFVGYMLYRMYA